MSSPRPSFLGSSLSSGQDKLNPRVEISMRDLYAVQKEFTQYVNIDELVPKLVANGLLSDSEVYTIRNPYLPPNQRVFELFQSISNKGPNAPGKVLEALVEKPLVPGHMYLASRLSGDSKLDASQATSTHFEPKINRLVARKIDNLKFMFADLLLETHRYLVSSGVSVEEFRIFVSFMSASRTNSSSLFFRDHLPSLSSASTIDQIMTIINENQYWNHFNYQLLEAVIRKFGDKTIRTKLEDYVDDVITFENSVSLSDYAVSVPSNLAIPDKPDFAQLKTTLGPESKWSTYSLWEARALQKKMSRELNIQEHSLLFQNAEQGSVVIIWLVPSSVEDSVFVQAQRRKAELHRIGIYSLVINRATVFMNEQRDDYENVPFVVDTQLEQANDFSAILHSLDSIERSVQNFGLSLHSHRQIIQKMSTELNKEFCHRESPLYKNHSLDFDRSQITPMANRSLSHNSIHTVAVPLPSRTNSLTTPSFDLKSQTPSPVLVSPSHVQPYSPYLGLTSVGRDSSSSEPELENELKLRYSRDESEREHVNHWLPDSGYSERNEWTS